jgi:hypothetical protein
MHAACQTMSAVESLKRPFPREKCEDICTKMDFLVRDRTVLGKIMPFPATEDPLLFKSLQLEKPSIR